MQSSNLKKNISQVYLSLVPLLVSIFGFTTGHISYKIYLPVWIVNMCIMAIAAWLLCDAMKSEDIEKKQLAAGAFFFIAPWMLISMFFGLGPPPQTSEGWVQTSTEQQARYMMLVIAGVFIAIGFAVLREKLRNTKGSFYSLLGFTAIMIAIPLFIINMIWWGSYLVQFFKIMVESGKKPDWFVPVRAQFAIISMVEVSLTYLATAAFAIALKTAGWFRKTPSYIYIALSVLCFFLVVLPLSTDPFYVAGYFVTIPAIPFLMPYYIGINLLRRARS